MVPEPTQPSRRALVGGERAPEGGDRGDLEVAAELVSCPDPPEFTFAGKRAEPRDGQGGNGAAGGDNAAAVESVPAGILPSLSVGWSGVAGVTTRVAAPKGVHQRMPHGDDSPDGADSPLTSSEPEFVLLDVVGAGGQGDVWRARQTSLAREVAVKVLRRRDVSADLGYAARQVRDFVAEAHTAAALDHPNIVGVHSLGADPSTGAPMLAMKLVRGTEWSVLLERDATLPLDEVLARHLPILVAVCHAVAFAHDRGIIHRDLKPPQVIIGDYGEVLLTDWGLAVRWREVEAGDDEIARRSMVPRLHEASNPAGTPSYMAPEQTCDDPSGIGPWTDIYLLGGILYSILTQTLPHRGASRVEVLKSARRGVVERAERRNTRRAIPAALADLAERALRPEPSARLQSAAELRRGLEEYLTGAANRREAAAMAEAADRDVAALPADAPYAALAELDARIERALSLWSACPEAQALRRRVRLRHVERAVAQGDLALARALLPADAGDSAQGRAIAAAEAARARQHRQRRMLLATSLLLLGALVVGGIAASVHQARLRREAERNLQHALSAANALVAGTTRGLKPIVGTRSATVAALLEDAERIYEGLVRDAAGAPGLDEGRIDALLSFAELYEELGDTDRAMERVERAADLLAPFFADGGPEPGPALWHSRARSQLVAGSIMKARGKSRPALAGYRLALLDLDRAEARRRDAGDDLLRSRAQRGLMAIHIDDGDTTAALALGDALLATTGRLASDLPEDAEAQDALASAHGWLGAAHDQRGDLDAAAASFTRVLEVLGPVVARDPSQSALRRTIAVAHHKLGDIWRKRGDLARATAAFEEDLRVIGDLARSDPDNASWRRDMLVSRVKLAEVRQEAGDLAGAVAHYEGARDAGRTLVALDASNLGWRTDASFVLATCADLQRRLGRTGAAADSMREAAETLDVPGLAEGGDAEALVFVTYVGARHVEMLLASGDTPRARTTAQTLVAQCRALAEAAPDMADAAEMLAYALTVAAGAHAADGHLAAGRTLEAEAVAATEALVASDASRVDWAVSLAQLLASHAETVRAAGQGDDAAAWAARAVTLARAARDAMAGSREMEQALAAVLLGAAQVGLRRGDAEAAAALLDGEAALFAPSGGDAGGDAGGDPEQDRLAAGERALRAEILAIQRGVEAARAPAAEALALRRHLAALDADDAEAQRALSEALGLMARLDGAPAARSERLRLTADLVERFPDDWRLLTERAKSLAPTLDAPGAEEVVGLLRTRGVDAGRELTAELQMLLDAADQLVANPGPRD